MIMMLFAPTALALLIPHGRIGHIGPARTVSVRMDLIVAGEILPELQVQTNAESEEASDFVNISSVLGPGRSVLCGMPGAFTPTCTDMHLPSFYECAAEYKKHG